MALVIRARLGTFFSLSAAIITSLITTPAFARFDTLHIDLVRVAALSTGSKALVQISCKRLCEVLGAIAVMEGPATVDMLANLLDMPQDQVMRNVQALVDVLLLAVEPVRQSLTINTPLQVCHPSLRTFLLDLQRCRYDRPWRAHDAPAQRCLQLLNQSLQQDICDIQDFRLANSAVANLQELFSRGNSSALCYASEHALMHLALSGAPHEHLCLELFTFCNEHLLQWIELLTIQDRLAIGLQQLQSAFEWCQVRDLLCFQ
jgi:hypothetical protein